jgi:hypothetical protein
MSGPRTEGLVRSLCSLRRKARSVAPKAPAAMLDARAALRERLERVRTLLARACAWCGRQWPVDGRRIAKQMGPAPTTWFFETFVVRDFVRKVCRNRRYFASIVVGE